MATRGRPPKSTKATLKCLKCKNEYVENKFYSSNSEFYSGVGKIPFCKSCIEDFYNYYCEKYKSEYHAAPEKSAVKRLCMVFDVYYSDDAFDKAIGQLKKTDKKMSIIASYMKLIHLNQYKDKSYDDTFNHDEYDKANKSYDDVIKEMDIDESIVDFFGVGFSEDDYKYLKKEYDDWVARHECKTKAQEEVFKRLCFKQLEILKATRLGEDTKDLDATFQKLLETAKLQPRQNAGDTTADNQTFGTLIDKWENTRPLPEIDEELKDVDRIGLYFDVFVRGHLSKMMGLKNGFSNLYTKFMKKYSVEKPEYDDDENSEVLFDAIFGNASLDSDDE